MLFRSLTPPVSFNENIPSLTASCFVRAIPLSRQCRGGFSRREIQRLGRPAREGSPERAAYHIQYPIVRMPPLAISSLERCPVCVGDSPHKSAFVGTAHLSYSPRISPTGGSIGYSPSKHPLQIGRLPANSSSLSMPRYPSESAPMICRISSSDRL